MEQELERELELEQERERELERELELEQERERELERELERERELELEQELEQERGQELEQERGHMIWNFTHGNKLYEYEADTKAAIVEKANEWFAEYCQQEAMKNGEVMRDVVTLVGVDDDDRLIAKEPYTVEYEHYHGNFKEHGVNN